MIKNPGVPQIVCEINGIKCKFSAILIRHCGHGNIRNTFSIDSS